MSKWSNTSLWKGKRPASTRSSSSPPFSRAASAGGIKESDAPSGVELLKRLGVPVFAPVISYYKDRKQWLDDPEGLGSQVAWSVAMPEFEGVIEPIVVGASRGISTPEEESYEALDDRIEKLADRIARWVGLAEKAQLRRRKSPSSSTTTPAPAWRRPWAGARTSTRWRASSTS